MNGYIRMVFIHKHIHIADRSLRENLIFIMDEQADLGGCGGSEGGMLTQKFLKPHDCIAI